MQKRKNLPFLRFIQRVEWRPGRMGSLDDCFTFEYMGSSEFEFGTLPRSIYGMRKFDQKTGLESNGFQHGDTHFYYLGPTARLPEAVKLVTEELDGTGTHRRKEPTHMLRRIKRKPGETWPRCDSWLAVVKWPDAGEEFPETECPFFLSIHERARDAFRVALRSKEV